MNNSTLSPLLRSLSAAHTFGRLTNALCSLSPENSHVLTSSEAFRALERAQIAAQKAEQDRKNALAALAGYLVTDWTEAEIIAACDSPIVRE